jgi:hypothetical protein
MREFRSYGSARGAAGNSRSYRERRAPLETVCSSPRSSRTPNFRKGPTAEYGEPRPSADECFYSHINTGKWTKLQRVLSVTRLELWRLAKTRR